MSVCRIVKLLDIDAQQRRGIRTYANEIWIGQRGWRELRIERSWQVRAKLLSKDKAFREEESSGVAPLRIRVQTLANLLGEPCWRGETQGEM